MVKTIAVFLLLIGIFIAYPQPTYAASENVTVTVTDKQGKPLPFAHVVIGHKDDTTDPTDKTASFKLDIGQYTVSATQPLITKKGEEVVGKAKFNVTPKKKKVAVTVVLNGTLPNDATGPTITSVQPTSETELRSSEAVTITAVIQDKESKIARVSAKLDGAALDKPKKEKSRYTWLTKSLPTGEHTVTFTTWNYSGLKTVQESKLKVVGPNGIVRGRVTYEGTPVGHASVSTDDGKTAATDDSGFYFLSNVAAGQRKLTVKADQFDSLVTTVTVKDRETLLKNLTLADSIAPTVPTNLVITNQTPTSTKQTVTWDKANDASALTYKVERSVGSTIQTTITTDQTTANFDGLTPNTNYSYRVQAIDAKNNQGAWTAKVSKKTQQLPSVTWKTPTVNQTVSGTVRLTGSYQSFGSGNATDKLTITLVSPETTIATIELNTASGDFSQNWDSTRVANGARTIHATIKDTEGNEAAADLGVTVDNPGSISGKITFEGNPVVGASLKTDDDKTALTDSTGSYSLTGVKTGTRRVTITTPGLKTATKDIAVIANQTASLDISDLVDDQPPTQPTNLKLANVVPTTTNQIVSWDPSTDPSGIKAYTVEQFKNNTLLKAVDTTTLSASFSNLTPDTNYSYRITATDNKNFQATTTLISGKTQKQPTISWTAPTANAKLKGSATLTASYQAFGNSNVVNEVKFEATPSTLIATQTPKLASGAESVTWNTVGMANGAATLRVTATDKEGNVVSSDLAVTIENLSAITGTVKQSNNNNPVEKATVVIKRGANTVSTQVTGANGTFQLLDIPEGTYSVSVKAEGYADNGTGSFVIKAGETKNVDIALVQYARLTFTLNEKKITGLGEPHGLAVNPLRNELYVSDNGSGGGVYNYNATTLARNSLYQVATGSAGSFIAYDYSWSTPSFLTGAYGRSQWYDLNTGNREDGPVFSFSGGTSYSDSPVVVSAGTYIVYYKNRQDISHDGYNLENIVGGIADVAINEHSTYVTGMKKIAKLNRANPADATKAIIKDVAYDVAEIDAIPNSRTLIVADTNGGKLHLFDSVTLEEYQQITINGEDNGRIEGMASDWINNKLYVSSVATGTVYMFDGKTFD